MRATKAAMLVAAMAKEVATVAVATTAAMLAATMAEGVAAMVAVAMTAAMLATVTAMTEGVVPVVTQQFEDHSRCSRAQTHMTRTQNRARHRYTHCSMRRTCQGQVKSNHLCTR